MTTEFDQAKAEIAKVKAIIIAHVWTAVAVLILAGYLIGRL